MNSKMSALAFSRPSSHALFICQFKYKQDLFVKDSCLNSWRKPHTARTSQHSMFSRSTCDFQKSHDWQQLRDGFGQIKNACQLWHRIWDRLIRSYLSHRGHLLEILTQPIQKYGLALTPSNSLFASMSKALGLRFLSQVPHAIRRTIGSCWCKTLQFGQCALQTFYRCYLRNTPLT